MKATLDGIVLPVDAGAGWSETEGTAPHIRDFEVPNEVAQQLFFRSEADSSVLEIDDTEAGGERVRITGLSVLETGPTNDPNTSTVTVADLRWKWSYPSLYRAYNIRVLSGGRRRISQEGPSAPEANDVIVDDAEYDQWSKDTKNGGVAWTCERVIEDILDAIAGPGNWENRSVIGAVKLPDVENWVFEGHYDAVLGQLFSEIGMAVSVYVRNGKVILYNRLDDTERRLVGAPTVGGTRGVGEAVKLFVGTKVWQEQNRERVRPKAVELFFDRKIELRINGSEQLAEFNQTELRRDPFPQPKIKNVLRSPEDFTHEGREIIAGQYIDLDFYLTYLAGKQPAGLPALTLEIIRKGWISDLLSAYQDPAFDPSGLWAVRIDAITEHYRLTYQIDKVWRQRIRTIEPIQLSVNDRETGQKAEAPVFCDYAQFETWRSRGKTVAARPEVHDIVRNRYSNPTSRTGGNIIGTNISELKPAKASIEVVNEDQGIIRLNFGTGNDTQYKSNNILRSAIDPGAIPSDDISLRNLWLQEGKLTLEHEISVLLAITLGAPADIRRYHRITVDVVGAKDFMPTRRNSIPAGTGPVLQVKIPASLVVAKHGWDQSKAQGFYETFSENGPIDDIDDILGDPVNLDQLDIVAKAKAATVYSRFTDRVEGGATTDLRPELTIRGSATAVSWEADPAKGAISEVDLPGEAPPLDIISVLPPQLRRTLNKLVDLKE